MTVGDREKPPTSHLKRASHATAISRAPAMPGSRPRSTYRTLVKAQGCAWSTYLEVGTYFSCIHLYQGRPDNTGTKRTTRQVGNRGGKQTKIHKSAGMGDLNICFYQTVVSRRPKFSVPLDIAG
jgi:hypothetical protein